MGADGVTINDMGSGNVIELSGEATGAVKFKPSGWHSGGNILFLAFKCQGRWSVFQRNREDAVQAAREDIMGSDRLSALLETWKSWYYLRVLNAKTGTAHAQVHSTHSHLFPHRNPLPLHCSCLWHSLVRPQTLNFIWESLVRRPFRMMQFWSGHAGPKFNLNSFSHPSSRASDSTISWATETVRFAVEVHNYKCLSQR